MKTGRVSRYGSPEVIEIADVPRPKAGAGEVLVRVKAAGVGPWDALIREGRSGIPQSLPLTLGSDLSGVVEAAGSNVSAFHDGDEVYGLTNSRFTGGYAEYAAVSASSIAPKPQTLTFSEAASAPVVAVTAWQMLFEYGHAAAGQKVLVHGAGGNVGAYAVQLARNAGIDVIATASSRDLDFARSLGAGTLVDYRAARFEDVAPQVDLVIDTVGGEIRERSYQVLKPGGILVTVVSPASRIPPPKDIKVAFFFVDVTTARLDTLTQLFEAGKLTTDVGTVLPLGSARLAHEMLAGAPHPRGKIVLELPEA